jgi:hypothetical protein
MARVVCGEKGIEYVLTEMPLGASELLAMGLAGHTPQGLRSRPTVSAVTRSIAREAVTAPAPITNKTA